MNSGTTALAIIGVGVGVLALVLAAGAVRMAQEASDRIDAIWSQAVDEEDWDDEVPDWIQEDD